LTRASCRGLLAAVAACALALGSQPAGAATTGNVSVLGPRLLKDGIPWIPRGVQIVGIVAPDSALSGKYITAHQHYSPAELQQAAADGADLIRFQVSEFGLDPNGPLYSPAYVGEVESAVATARSLGLEVIVSIQAEGPAGENTRCALPGIGTERVWAELAPVFAGDHGVMFELYNEPAPGPSTTAWQLWLDGGPVIQAGQFACQAVGMQTLVDVIRGAGATNVIVVPGLAGETTLAGAPAMTDPADPSSPQLAYGIHYPLPSGPTTLWDAEFGRFSARAPVIITEWQENSTTNCFSDAPDGTGLLLAYLAAKQIGVVGFAFDLPGTIVADYTYAPTTFASFACGVPGGGPGQVLLGEYAAMAQADPSPATGLPAWIISAGALEHLETLDPAMAGRLFDTPRTFVTGAGAPTVSRLAVPAAVPAASFASETTLAADVTAGVLRPGTRAVVFDDEHWSRTPVAQQLQPGVYFHLAAQVAHQHGLLLIADPATNLVIARSPRTPKSAQYAKFLQLRIAAAAARYADIYEIDARGIDTFGPDYTSFVRAASAQAASIAPSVELVATLSSGSAVAGRRSTALLNAALGTRSLVSGYQLNDFRAGASCAGCAANAPAVASAFLSDLLAADG
jgi:hypothetical protein